MCLSLVLVLVEQNGSDPLIGRVKKSQGRQEQQKKHQHASNATDQESAENQNILEWDSPLEFVPFCQEESIVQFIFERNGKKERGMFKEKPSFLLDKYKKAMKEHAPAMSLPQVLSLRRHHINLFNKSTSMSRLRLGERNDIDESARIFEVVVEKFLKKCSVEYLTEEDQKKKAKEKQTTLKATPDFVLPKPMLLQKIRKNESKASKRKNNPAVLEERTIHWIEVKMYYGASSIPHGSKGAVGSVLAKSQKYVDYFGEGAILFMMGCGDKLAAELNEIGVSVLDCSGNTVSLEEVHDHQRTWCANDNGQILP